MKVRLERTFRFESAHWLPMVPEEHKCRRMHGHNFVIDVILEGAVDPQTGWLVDFFEVDKAWEPLFLALDHRCLNDLEGLQNPTSEMLSAWIWERLKPRLPQLCEVVVHETCAARCRYWGE